MSEQGITTRIVKGPIHAAVDKLLNTKEENVYIYRAQFLQDLIAIEAIENDDEKVERYVRLYSTAMQEYLGLPQKQGDNLAKYLHCTWYVAVPCPDVGYPPFWPASAGFDIHPTEPIARLGLIHAIQQAKDKLPIYSYWLPTADSNTFETIILKTAEQVTRIILTPPTPSPTDPTRRPLNYDESISLVKRSAQADPKIEVPVDIPTPVKGAVVTRINANTLPPDKQQASPKQSV